MAETVVTHLRPTTPQKVTTQEGAGTQDVSMAGDMPTYLDSSVVLIISDDIGKEQHSIDDAENLWPPGYAHQGPPDYEGYAPTDALDAMVAAGVRFSGFRSQPICGPTRAELFSGYLPSVTGRGNNNQLVAQESWVRYLPQLIENGLSSFHTGLFGKWGLSDPTAESVVSDGRWEVFKGLPHNIVYRDVDGIRRENTYDSWDYYQAERATVDAGGSATLERGRTEWPGKTIADAAFAWINGIPDEERYLCVIAFPMAHTPLVGGQNWPPSGHHVYGSGSYPSNNYHCNAARAHLDALDYQIARIKSSIAHPGPVTFLYCTDNGSTVDVLAADQRTGEGVANDPPAGYYDATRGKDTIYESGHRGTLVVDGAAVALTEQNTVDAGLCQPADVFATVADMCCQDWRSQVPDADGVSLLPRLQGDVASTGRRYSYQEMFEPVSARTEAERAWTERAVTDGLYSLIRRTGTKAAEDELFRIEPENDEDQQTDLVAAAPGGTPAGLTGEARAAWVDLDTAYTLTWGS